MLLLKKGRSSRLPLRAPALFCWLLLGILLLVVGPVFALEPGRGDKIRQEIAGVLARSPALPADGAGQPTIMLGQEVIDFYQSRNHRALWQSSSGLRIAAHALVERLRSAAEHGLCGEDYLLEPIERRMAYRSEFVRRGEPLPPRDAAILDLLLTQSFFTYGTHLVEGRVDPALAHVDWKAKRRKLDLAKLLPSAVDGDSLGRLLAELVPPHEGYRELMEALADLRVFAARGGWPRVPGGESLRPGDIDPRLPKIRARLLATGELPEPADIEGNAFGPATVEAVQRFQQRHGLDPDGVIGWRTVRAMNIPVEQRIRQIEFNLERWRWVPRDLGRQYIAINVADFSLAVVKNDQVVMSMPVIVGTPYRKTPVFSAQMSYLEFAPYWTVPPTILREDKLPAIQKNPDFLQEQRFRIVRSSGRVMSDEELGRIDWHQVEAERFPGDLRMDPGPWNPLGQVKFMFPNAFNVYLHDTNERGLFDRYRRTYSSGCIRIGDPVGLARYLLQDQPKWTEERLQEALGRSTPLQVNITNPIPTHLQYWTTWVDADGTIQFRPDLYHRDLDLEVALSDAAMRTGPVVARPENQKPLRVSRAG